MSWKFLYSSPLAGGSKETRNGGHTPVQARRSIRYVNNETGEVSTSTDLIIKKRKKREHFEEFRDTYTRIFKQKQISLLLIEVNIDRYPCVRSFLKDFKKKLARKKLKVMGYVWCRDIGSKRFQRHFHIMLTTERLEKDLIKDLFKDKKHDSYNVKLCNSINKFNRYLTSKELYAPFGSRSYGRSRNFDKPDEINNNKKGNEFEIMPKKYI